MESVFEYERSDSLVCQGLRDFPTFVAHGQPPEAASGCYDDSRPVTFSRFRQEWGKRSSGNIPCHRIAPLAEPRFSRRLVFNASGIERNGVGFCRSFEWIDCPVLRRRKCRGEEEDDNDFEFEFANDDDTADIEIDLDE